MSFPEPGHLRPGAAVDGREVQDRRLTLSDHLPLLFVREIPHICGEKSDPFGSSEVLAGRGPKVETTIFSGKVAITALISDKAGGRAGSGAEQVLRQAFLSPCCDNSRKRLLRQRRQRQMLPKSAAGRRPHPTPRTPHPSKL